MSKPRTTLPKMISAHGIARALNRSPQGVLDAIGRLGLEPLTETPSGKYYPMSALSQVEAGMRKPNGTRARKG